MPCRPVTVTRPPTPPPRSPARTRDRLFERLLEEGFNADQDTPSVIRSAESEDPDRIVTTNDSKKPKEDDTKLAAVQTSASEESAAQEATARQVFEGAKESDTPTVVHQGIGKDAQRLAAEWGQQLSAYFKIHQVYPEVRKTKNVKVKVSIVLNRLGKVLDVGILESSGDRLYDEAAVSMIRRSDPVPRPPAKLTDEQFNYALDVSFEKSK